MKKYHTLAVKCPDQLWGPEFGDYDKEVVKEEMRDQKNNGGWPKKTKFKIITTSDKQKAISAAVALLNGVEA